MVHSNLKNAESKVGPKVSLTYNLFSVLNLLKCDQDFDVWHPIRVVENGNYHVIY